jgi:hypothetical protein
MASLTIVEDHQLFEYRVCELDAGAPASAIEELDLHATPERFDDCVVVAVTDRYRSHET